MRRRCAAAARGQVSLPHLHDAGQSVAAHGGSLSSQSISADWAGNLGAEWVRTRQRGGLGVRWGRMGAALYF
eukprot:scaffold2668_cov115-Isochrysis_galbana.AAC.4